MIKSPSAFSNNFSLQNLDNYLKTVNPKIKLLDLYDAIISEYLELSSVNINISDPIYAKFIVHKGIEMLSHIFNTIFLYTKNANLCEHYCNKASHYYIEFIGQISEDSHSFLQLNSKDAILFVYKKTIFDINNEYRKNYIISESDKIIFDSVKKETDFVNKMLFYLLENIKYIDIHSYIINCASIKNNLLMKFDYRKSSEKNYYNTIDNALLIIEIHKNHSISVKRTEEVLLLLIKKNMKKYIDTTAIQKKIKQNDINELYDKLTISKFINWLIEN